ncbi:hypothetical protein AB4059_13370 [Lysobacter sp. 2RAF19]
MNKHSGGQPSAGPTLHKRLSGVLGELRSRVHWEPARALLKAAGFHASLGWEQTTTNLLDKLSEADESKVETLEAALLEVTRVYNKDVRFYKFTPKALSAIKAAIQSQQSGTLARGLELIAAANATARTDSPQPFYAMESVAGDFLSLASIREFEVRQHVNPEYLGEERLQNYGDVSDLIVITRERRLAIDGVRILDNELLEISVDSVPGSSPESIETAHMLAQRQITDLAGVTVSVHPLNLFNGVSSLYKDKNEGVVAELAFATHTASLKHEKMRKAGLCLRKELYHLGGSAAVGGAISPYRVAIRWPPKALKSANLANVELGLNGTARLLHSKTPFIGSAEILGCLRDTEFAEVRSRLLKHI